MKSTAAQKAAPSGVAAPKKAATAGTQAPPVDAPKRPAASFDKKTYQRELMRKRRTKTIQ